MTSHTTRFERTARRLTGLAIAALVATTGTAAAHTGDATGMMTGWGLFGGAMGLWGLLWMVLLFGLPLYLAYALLTRQRPATADASLSTLRERYARGELSADEFERRRARLDETD